MADGLPDTRKQQVVVDGAMSAKTLIISARGPSGSVLGPLLFSIYIDVTELELSSQAECVLYADDILNYKPVTQLDDFAALQFD